ncbi:MAG: efflux transporter outer membrane subunit [Desulfosoma sp.]
MKSLVEGGERSRAKRFLGIFWAGLSAVILMGGCTVGPNYRRPEATAVPQAYSRIPEGWKMAEPQAHLPKGRWWEIFGDSELNRLENQAQAANQNLKAAYARFAQARAVADAARSGLFPRLGASFQALEQHDSENRPVGGKRGQTYDVFTVPFDLSYEVDLWGRVRRSAESASAQAEAFADDAEAVKLSIQAEAAADYFTIRTLDADRALLLSTIDVYQKSLELVRNRRSGGVASDLDVAQAETVLKTARAQVSDNALQRAKFETALAVLLGQNPSLFHLVEAPLDLGPPVAPDPGLPSALLERRPDIAASERRMAAANAQIGTATAAFFPTIKLGLTTGFWSGALGSDRDLSTLFEKSSQFWIVNPALILPVIQGGQLSANLRQAKAAYEEAVARYRQTVLAAFAEVESSLAAVHHLARQYDDLRDALVSARTQLDVAHHRYVAGLVTYLQVATAQNTSLGIERSALRLRGQQLVATVGLIKALGAGWESPSSVPPKQNDGQFQPQDPNDH